MLVFFPKPDQITFIGVTFFLRNKVICTNAHGINIKNYNNYYNHELLSSQQVKKYIMHQLMRTTLCHIVWYSISLGNAETNKHCNISLLLPMWHRIFPCLSNFLNPFRFLVLLHYLHMFSSV